LGILVSLIVEVVTCFWLLAPGGWRLAAGQLLRENASSKKRVASSHRKYSIFNFSRIGPVFRGNLFIINILWIKN
jgi:hypothetical protein